MPRSGVARISRLAISIVLIALGVTQTAPVEVNAAGESWFNSSWQLRKSITIDAAKVSSGPHTDFPVLVNLSSDTSLAANAQADADDILFTSSGGATQLKHEIEKYGSATGALVAWVKVPSLPSATDTVLFMYYSNGSAASQQDATGVWSNGYEAVYHLNGNFPDSTSNARNATNSGTVDATGRIANGRDFEFADSTDKLTLGTWSVSGTGLTIQSWVNFESFDTGDGRLISKNQGDAADDHVFMLSSTAGPLLRYRQKTGTNDAANTQTFIATSGTLLIGTWYLAAATYDGSNMIIYRDGTSVGSVAKTVTGDMRENAWAITAGNQANTNQPLDGILDEIRISSVARNAGWLTTEYNNQGTPTTFYTLGAAENVPIAPPPSEPPPRATLTINSTSPTNVAAGVAVNTSVSATFSMLMNGSTLTTSTFKLSGGGGDVSGVVTTNGATATFTPSSNLAHNTTYTATITTGAKAANFTGTTLDNDNTWSFTTAENSPPTVSSTNPANGVARVAINSIITVTFSEAMQSSTINTNTFTVSDGSGNISGTVSYSGTTATFTPSRNLSSFITYTATITTGVRDVAGDALASDYTWSFTTADIISPTVISTSPANGAAGVSVNSNITVTFSEEMDASTITTGTFKVSDGSINISGTVSHSGTTATFTPSTILSFSATYTVTITTGAKDVAGNALASDYTWSFSTVDITPPTVISTSPANGAADVSINSSITASFSESIDASTITTDTFTVSNGSGNIRGTVSSRGTTATFTPSTNLTNSATYTTTITTGVKDLAGNAMASSFIWSFTTTEITPPVVRSTTPANGAAEVAVNSIITATFSEVMDASTITTDTFMVSDGGNTISGTVSYGGTTATFKPLNSLSYTATYTAAITTGVKDLAGNAMSADYTWSFTTASEPDITPPAVISISPANGAADASINSSITATFSEEVDASTITTDTFTVSDGSGNISGTVSYKDKVAAFKPSNPLSSSITYKAKITTGVRDVAGNALSADYTWSFTPDTTPPTVISTSPANGEANVSVNSSITATFSEKTDASTITTSTFTLSDGFSNIGGTISSSSMTAIFKPSGNLSYSTTYTAKITPGVRDIAGNALAAAYTWGFTTILSTISPTVISTSPANGVADISINRDITATFSKAMDASTITTDTFVVSDDSNNIGGTVSYSGTTATFKPLNSLSYSTTYTVKINLRVRDVEGNPIASPFTWSFTTISLSSTPVFTPTPTAIPTVTLTPLLTPTATPTPGVCEATRIRLKPRSLSLNREEMDEVTVTVTGEGGCPVEDVLVMAKINRSGKKIISVSSINNVTDANGQAIFKITSTAKTGRAKVAFNVGSLKKYLIVHVRK